MKVRRWLIVGIVVAAVAILMLPPYLSWLDYEPDVVVTKTEDIAPELVWDYPWDRGLEISVDWTASVFEKEAWPYATAINPATGLKEPCDLQVSYDNFDIVDVPDWVPTYTYTDTTPDKPGFWDYFTGYYGVSTAEVIPTDTLAYARLGCVFTYSEGSLAGTEVRIDLVPDDPSAKDIIYSFDEAGDYSDSFVIYTRTYSGTYEFSLTVLAEVSATLTWDVVTFEYINRY